MHFSLSKIRIAGICLMVLCLALPAGAQMLRTFRGKVTDDKGEPIKGATIIIQAMDSKSRTFTTKTDKKGTWIYMTLPDGIYHVAARAPGFSPEYQSNIKTTVQEERVIDLQLKPGPDKKLPFEMTPEEYEKLKAESEKAQKRNESAAQVQALFDEGGKLADAGKHAEAIEKFQQALALDPQQANILGNMAESYRKLGKLDEALDSYKKAIAIAPNDGIFYTNMGVVLEKMGKKEESLEAYKKASTLNTGGSAQSHFNLGASFANSGKTDEAIDAFRQAIAADPNFADAYYQLGMSLSGKQETMEEAVKVLKKYLEIGKKQDQIDIAKAIIEALEQSLKKK
ncbi:MAG TPA: tetratricopeptide repeat protein [Acidobacteriota bacterium]|nr:tetratricopeptide repeat protein [Acidobacteriota bacterium]